MYAPASEPSPPRDETPFAEGPFLVGRHYSSSITAQLDQDLGSSSVVGVQGREDEDDSVAMVFSADTGAGRAHTPQRMNRTNTPQRLVAQGLKSFHRHGFKRRTRYYYNYNQSNHASAAAATRAAQCDLPAQTLQRLLCVVHTYVAPVIGAFTVSLGCGSRCALQIKGSIAVYKFKSRHF